MLTTRNVKIASLTTVFCAGSYILACLWILS